jgi:hypothetical protein
MTQACCRSAPLVVLLVAGCSQPGGPEGDDDGANILLVNENNYRSTASLSLPVVATASGVDLDICWTNIADDLQCHPVTPRADIDNVAFIRFLHLTPAEVEAMLVAGEVKQSRISGYVEFPTANQTTCARLSQFSFLGTKVDVVGEYRESADETHLLLFAHGLQRGVGARVMMFLQPTTSVTNTRVDAPSGCGTLDFHADITSLLPVPVPATAPWIIDWRGVTRDGQGNDVVYATLDRLLLAYYQHASLADIQANFMDIELMATSLWDLELIGGYTADLSQAIERTSGEPFAGFGGASDGVWGLGLICGTCQNPAPVIFTVLDPSGGST